MITKKHLLVAVLVTFCLTFVLFGISPTRSANNPYDPWLDTNDDGVINMRDIGAECGAFGATGDPTKNVTITGHANKLAYSVESQSSPYTTPWISVDGYDKMIVSVAMTSMGRFNYTQVFSRHYNGSSSFELDYTIMPLSRTYVCTYYVPNQEISVYAYAGAGVTATISIDVYLIP